MWRCCKPTAAFRCLLESCTMRKHIILFLILLITALPVWSAVSVCHQNLRIALVTLVVVGMLSYQTFHAI